MTARRAPRRFRLADPLPLLEDRLAPAVFTAATDPLVDLTGAVAEVIGFFQQANTNADADDTINLWPNGQYVFSKINDAADGGTALPVFTGTGPTDSLTVLGNGATFTRGGPNSRFFRADGGTGLLDVRFKNLTFDGGAATDTNTPVRPGSYFGGQPSGGSILVEGTRLALDGVTVRNSTAAFYGGGVAIGDVTPAGVVHTFVNSFVQVNSAAREGGGVYAGDAGAVRFQGSTLAKNASSQGAGGVSTFRTAAEFATTLFQQNTGSGGAAYVDGGAVVTDTFFDRNSSGSGDPAGLESTSSVTARRSTFSQNVVGGALGSASAIQAVSVELENVTIDRNEGPNAAVRATGAATVRYSTITRNNTSFGLGTSGGLRAGTAQIVGSVIAQNTSDTADPLDVTGVVTSGGFNFFGVAPAVYTPAQGDIAGTVAVPLNPQLGNLALYGATNGVPTRAPRQNSPLRGAGGPAVGVPTDARGLTRPVTGQQPPNPVDGAAEIGAFEQQVGEVLPAPTVFNAAIDPRIDMLGAVNEVREFFRVADANGDDENTINLFNRQGQGADVVYLFDGIQSVGQSFLLPDGSSVDPQTADGGTVLPVYRRLTSGTSLTINGFGATFARPAGDTSYRFVRVLGDVLTANGPTLFLNDVGFFNGNTYDVRGFNLTTGLFPDLSGGAVRTDNARVVATGVTFAGNTSADDGGGLAVVETFGFGARFGDNLLTRSSFVGNYAGRQGGGVRLEGTTGSTFRSGVAGTDLTFDGNVSLTGAGAMDLDDAALVLTRARVINNRGNTGGLRGSLVTLTDVLVQGNTSTGDGPAGVFATLNQLTLDRTTVANNTSTTAGAVVAGGTGFAAQLLNSTVTNNRGGSAAVVATDGQVALTFATIADNRSTGGTSAGVSVPNNVLTIYGSVLAGNLSSGTTADLDLAQLVRSDGGNFIGIAPNGYVRGTGDIAGNIGLPIDAKLNQLADNGGLTPTRAPLAGSPLYNAIANLSTASRTRIDQRGLTRPLTNADIGAFELQAGEPVPPPVVPPPPAAPAVFQATIVPADPVSNALAIQELVGFFLQARSNDNPLDEIRLIPGAKYSFNQAYTADGDFDGGTALPEINDAEGRLTIVGNGATFFRPAGAPSFRFLRAVGDIRLNPRTPGPVLDVRNMTFDGGNVYNLATANRIDVTQVAVLSGGAIRVDNAQLFATDATFVNNTSTAGGGAVAVVTKFGYAAEQTFERVRFYNNFAGLQGGAVSSLRIDADNVIRRGLTFIDAAFDKNASLTGGGAIQGNNTTVFLTSTATATVLAPDYLQVPGQPPVFVSVSRVVGNTGATGGIDGDQVTAEKTLFRANSSTGDGPGAVRASKNILTLIGSTVANNTSNSAGALVGLAGGQAVELTNSTVTDNTGGSAAVSAPLGQVVMTYATVTDNTATSGTAGVTVDNNILTIYGSIIAGNKSGNTAADVTTTRLVRNLGFNLLGTVGFPLGANDISLGKGAVADLVAPLADNGGPVFTRLPRDNSPIINTAGLPDATRLTTDGRGRPRPAGGAADIGAVELQPGEQPAPPLPAPQPVVFRATIDPGPLGAQGQPGANNAAAVAELRTLFAAADSATASNANAPLAQIYLVPNATYVFDLPTSVSSLNLDYVADGGTALPILDAVDRDTRYQIFGNNATFLRPAGVQSFRFVRAASAANAVVTLEINDLTMRNGNVFDLQAAPRDQSGPTILNGGAVRVDGGVLNTFNARFVGNTAGADGGAVVAAQGKFTNTQFVDNYAGNRGGAVFGTTGANANVSQFFDFVGTTVIGNRSVDGTGGIQADVQSVLVQRSTVQANTGKIGGVSGFFVQGVESLFKGNVATGDGPSAVISQKNILRLIRSTLTENASADGATAVGQSNGQAIEILNSTIHANRGGSSALLASADDGQVVVSFSTITNNVTTSGNGAAVTSNVLTLYASVFSSNRVINTDGTFTSTPADIQADIYRDNGFNFIGVAPTNLPASFGANATNRIGRQGSEINPLLGPLQSYGAGTNTPVLVRLPAAGSPLINAAGTPVVTDTTAVDRLTNDARGSTTRPVTDFPRVSGSAADIGAGELLPSDTGIVAEPLLPLGPPPPPPPPPPPGPPAPPRPAAAFAAGPGSALDPFVPQAVGVTPGARNQKADGSATAATVAQTVPNQVILFNADGSVRLRAQPFGVAPPGGIRTAVADLTGDGVPDIVAGTGPGVATQVVVIDGVSGAVVFSYSPFEASFTGGVFVAAGDVTGDGIAEIVVSPDLGGGPRVQVLSGQGATFTAVADFFGIDDANFRGGARVTVGDLTGDGVGDLVVAAGAGGGPRVAVYTGGTIASGKFTTKPFNDFFAFEQNLRDGVYVSAADVDGDGRGDLIVGAGPGGGPRVLVLDGRTLGTDSVRKVADFFAGDPGDRRGVTVSGADLDGDTAADVVTGNQATGKVSAYLGAKLAAGTVAADRQVTPFGDFQGGVFVG